MYITPRVLIQQEFAQVPVYAEFPLPAFILGPHYSLTRYSVAAEKPYTALNSLDGEMLDSGNSYITDADTRYSFSNVPAGGDVDHSFTKVYAEAVEAQYFPNEELGSDDVADLDEVELINAPSGKPYTNRVRFSNLILKTENGHDRSSYFSNRNVAVGDLVKISDDLGNTVRARITDLMAETSDINEDLAAQIATVTYNGADGVTNGTKTFVSATADFIADEVVGKFITINQISGTPGVFKILACPSPTTLVLDKNVSARSSLVYSIGGVYNDVDNAPYQTADFAAAVSSTGSANETVTAANTSSAYTGYAAKRVVSDTYTVTVTTSGNASTARFSISSEHGVFLTKTNQSLDDLTLVIDDSNGNDVSIEFSENEGETLAFVKGNQWTVGEFNAAVNPINPTAGGEYEGTEDITYTIRVDRGGAFFDNTNAATCARITITSSGIDASATVLPKLDTSFSVGGRGVTAMFEAASNNGGLIIGDVYYIPVRAAIPGAVTIAEISEALPQVTIETATKLTATLSLSQASINIPEIRSVINNEVNWVQEENYITINAGITTYNTSLLSSSLEPARLPITSAKIFVEHRDLLQDYVTAIDSIRSLADVERKLGTVHPDNPLAQGVYDAALNAANNIVYFIAVQTDDLSGYTNAIKISEKSDKVYSFVPMTFDRTIQDAVVSHVNAYSTPEIGRWRICWLAARDEKTRLIYDLMEDGSDYQATITDDVAVSGTQIKLVTIEGAKFIEDGVRPNDTIRINFRLKADGKIDYDEYVVDRVRTNTTLTLTRSISTPITTPIKVQVVRNFTKSERAYNISHTAGDYNNRRVRMVFPDTYKYGGVVKQGYFAAAGLAGLRSSVVPHQGLTNSEFLGADDLSKVVIEFTADDLNTLAEQGVWIITQEVVGATPFVRHQLTTDTRSLNTSEDSITTNVDNISYALKHTLTPFIGRYNVNSENLLAVYSAIVAELQFRASSTGTLRAGNQLTDFSPADDILLLQVNPTYKDRIDVEVRLNVPYPLNYVNLKLLVQ
jgi:hypothetical protein